MTRISYPRYVLFSLTLLLVFLAPVAWAATPQNHNSLLGTWRVEPLDNSAYAVPCRRLSEIQFREKSIRMVPNTRAEKSDNALAGALFGLPLEEIGLAQPRISRVTYEKDGDNWFITLRDFDTNLVLESRNRDELLMQDPRCILKRSTNAGEEPAAASTASPVATAKASARPVNLEKIVAGFGVITLSDLRQTLKQKQANIVFDGAGRSPFSFSLVTRGTPGMASADLPVISYSFDSAERLRSFSAKRQIAETSQVTGVSGTPAKQFEALVKEYSTRYTLLRHVSSADRKKTSPDLKRFGGPETETAEFEGSAIKIMLSRINDVISETYSHKSDRN